MSIEKNKPNTLKHDKKPFTTILNETILSIRDPAALGFYTLLASKPEGWEIVEQFLMNHFGVGRDFCRKKMKYLKQVGVIEVNPIRGDRGRITGWETILKVQITEIPSSGETASVMDYDQITENPTSSESTRLLKIQEVVGPGTGGSAPINKRYIQNKENIKQRNNIRENEYPETYYPVTQKKQNQIAVDELKSNNPHNIPSQMLEDWLQVRKTKKAPVTITAWKQIIKELNKCEHPIEAFEQMVASGWQGFKAEWVKKKNSFYDNNCIAWGQGIEKDIF